MLRCACTYDEGLGHWIELKIPAIDHTDIALLVTTVATSVLFQSFRTACNFSLFPSHFGLPATSVFSLLFLTPYNSVAKDLRKL